jgi:hypothetical protein
MHNSITAASVVEFCAYCHSLRAVPREQHIILDILGEPAPLDLLVSFIVPGGAISPDLCEILAGHTVDFISSGTNLPGAIFANENKPDRTHGYDAQLFRNVAADEASRLRDIVATRDTRVCVSVNGSEFTPVASTMQTRRPPPKQSARSASQWSRI